MNSDIEEEFVRDFINFLFQKRLLFELKSKKKRLDAIMKFSHNAENMINISCIHSKYSKFDYLEFGKFLNQEEYYVISFKYIDGQRMKINELLDYMQTEYSPIIAIGMNKAIIKKEFEKNSNNFLLLNRKY